MESCALVGVGMTRIKVRRKFDLCDRERVFCIRLLSPSGDLHRVGHGGIIKYYTSKGRVRFPPNLPLGLSTEPTSPSQVSIVFAQTTYQILFYLNITYFLITLMVARPFLPLNTRQTLTHHWAYIYLVPWWPWFMSSAFHHQTVKI